MAATTAMCDERRKAKHSFCDGETCGRLAKLRHLTSTIGVSVFLLPDNTGALMELMCQPSFSFSGSL